MRYLNQMLNEGRTDGLWTIDIIGSQTPTLNPAMVDPGKGQGVRLNSLKTPRF